MVLGLMVSFRVSSTVLTPGLLQKNVQKGVIVREYLRFSSVFRRIFLKIFKKSQKNRKM